jgi:molybdate transport system regulatory protein
MTAPRLALNLRLFHGAAIAIGPGKADLLDAIAATGSISAAARTMGLSYRRAWLLVETMNAAFAAPLVVASRGGGGGGGAVLTDDGMAVLGDFRAMTAAAGTAAAPAAARLIARLAAAPAMEAKP